MPPRKRKQTSSSGKNKKKRLTSAEPVTADSSIVSIASNSETISQKIKTVPLLHQLIYFGLQEHTISNVFPLTHLIFRYAEMMEPHTHGSCTASCTGRLNINQTIENRWEIVRLLINALYNVSSNSGEYTLFQRLQKDPNTPLPFCQNPLFSSLKHVMCEISGIQKHIPSLSNLSQCVAILSTTSLIPCNIMAPNGEQSFISRVFLSRDGLLPLFTFEYVYFESEPGYQTYECNMFDYSFCLQYTVEKRTSNDKKRGRVYMSVFCTSDSDTKDICQFSIADPLDVDHQQIRRMFIDHIIEHSKTTTTNKVISGEQITHTSVVYDNRFEFPNEIT